jgi:hypothetical protein
MNGVSKESAGSPPKSRSVMNDEALSFFLSFLGYCQHNMFSSTTKTTIEECHN